MKKTLIVTLEYPPQVGGIATFVREFAGALPDEKKVVVYAPNMKGDKDWDKGESYTVIRHEPYYLLLWPRWMRLYFQVKKIVKKEKIELIMVHHALPVGYVGWMMKTFHHIPYIVFSHGTDVLMSTMTSWKRRMIRKVTEKAESLIFNSESLKRRFLRVLPALEPKSLVMYPCPDKDLFIPPKPDAVGALKKQYALEGKQVLLSVGRMTDGKGFTHIARLLPHILKEHPHVVWVVIGDGPKMKHIVDTVQKYHLQNVVRFLGSMPYEKLKSYYYLADAFILLTHPDEGREEGLGLVFLEAAAAGLPAIAGKSGGVEEAVLDNKTGLIVDIYKGEKHVVDAIGALLDDKGFASTLGSNAKKRMEEEFRWERQLKKLDMWIQP